MLRPTKAGAVMVGAALALTACGGSSGGSGTAASPNAKVTLTWWHNANQDPLKGYFQQVADDYTAKHPNVTFKIEAIQNESIQTKIQVGLQSNKPPDIFQQWGGGDMATQVQSGKVQDITAATKTVADGLGGSASGWQVDGKQYGLPYSLGIVGFWYRTDLFKRAGIAAAPTSLDELYGDIDKLKAKGIAPIAIGGKDKWPDAFYWGYFATRECSTDVLKKASADQDVSDPCFTKAGQDTVAFMKKQPFQRGFLGTPAQQGAASSAGLLANGKAAIELQGHWNGGVIGGLTPDKKQLGAKLGWFPFPAVAGGAGDPTAAFGGGDGFSCSAKAPPACADFLNFLLSVDEQKKFGALNVGVPVAPGSASSVSDPTLQGVIQARDKSAFTQLYFDKAFTTSVGAALDDAIANLFAGATTPEGVVKSIKDAVASQ
jgi:raffinose/stachyose/melibiose transport system substrate-binding protein